MRRPRYANRRTLVSEWVPDAYFTGNPNAPIVQIAIRSTVDALDAAGPEAGVAEPRGDGAAGQQVCMHGRMAIYSISADAHELARSAEEGMLPILQAQSGFKAYSLVATGDELLSFSAWESEENAEAASEAAASWIAENIADKITLKETRIGEILLGTAIGVSTRAGISA